MENECSSAKAAMEAMESCRKAEFRPAHPENFVKWKQPEIAVSAEWQ